MKTRINPCICNQHERLEQYVYGQLPQEQERQIELHILECEVCSDVVEGLMLLTQVELSESKERIQKQIDLPSKSTRKTYWMYGGIAASIVLIMSLVAVIKTTLNERSERYQATLKKDLAQQSTHPIVVYLPERPKTYLDDQIQLQEAPVYTPASTKALAQALPQASIPKAPIANLPQKELVLEVQSHEPIGKATASVDQYSEAKQSAPQMALKKSAIRKEQQPMDNLHHFLLKRINWEDPALSAIGVDSILLTIHDDQTILCTGTLEQQKYFKNLVKLYQTQNSNPTLQAKSYTFYP